LQSWLENCSAQSVAPLDNKTQVHAVEDEIVTLSCRYEGRADNLQWYRQYPGSRPEFLLLKYPGAGGVVPADPPFPRLDATLHKDIVNLSISSAAVSDSALYYCALRPTETGNPATLYKNSLQ
uniref:Ig-like domain-containing protein n=1 Tax=Pygocentrus nattereri TaxID=42514 RepID=A0A3B4EKF5_PYGNA